MATAEQSQPSELGIADAAERISVLDGPESQPEQETNEAADAEVEQTEATDSEGDYDSSDEVEAASDDATSDDDDAEEYEQAEDADQEQTSDDMLVTVKIDGKTEQITVKEAVDGYQRQADYQRKTQALAEEKRGFEAERQQVAVERQYYAERLDALQNQLDSLALQEPDWDALYEEDPIVYSKLRNDWRDYKDNQAALQAEQEQIAQIQQQEHHLAMKNIVDNGKAWLLEQVPEWREESKWEATKNQLREYGKKIGYSDEELSAAYDPRAIIVLEKARKYDALQANRPRPQKGNAPKPMKPSSSVASPKKGNDLAKMRQRLKSSGDVKDAAMLFNMLDK